jgi:DNA-binding transcriptional regulator YhcF (GntR family)
MESALRIQTEGKTPKYLQVIDSVKDAIRQGELKKGDHIFSINNLSDEYLISRNTVQKAYTILRQQGVITSVKGKGFYINRIDITRPYRVLLIFNKISNYKKQIYNAFVSTMGEKATVDLKIHHFDTRLFEQIVSSSLSEYDYLVIMPHFYDDQCWLTKIIKSIPENQLVILDKDIQDLYSPYRAVYQDFKNDIISALETGLESLKKYKKIILVQPKKIPYPPEIVTGFRFFCMQYKFDHAVIHEVEKNTPVNEKEAFIVIEETDLVRLIQNCNAQKLQIGKQVGIISYNDTPMKEILQGGITVISTDHAIMGETAARLILENRNEKIKNPFRLILRKSL